MKDRDYIESYKKRYLQFSFRNIFIGTIFMLSILTISDLLIGDFTWNNFYIKALMALVFAIGNIALQKYWYNKGELHIPKPPKYSGKSYAEIQAEKAAKSKDA